MQCLSDSGCSDLVTPLSQYRVSPAATAREGYSHGALTLTSTELPPILNPSWLARSPHTAWFQGVPRSSSFMDLKESRWHIPAVVQQLGFRSEMRLWKGTYSHIKDQCKQEVQKERRYTFLTRAQDLSPNSHGANGVHGSALFGLLPGFKVGFS